MKSGAVIGGVALAALASLPAALPAVAADMSPIAPRPAASSYIPAQFFWTGFYIGAGIGGGWGTLDVHRSVRPRATRLAVAQGLPGQRHIGHQLSNQLRGRRRRGRLHRHLGQGLAPSMPPATTLSTSVFWTASITGRVGMAFDRLLVYGKGGAGLRLRSRHGDDPRRQHGRSAASTGSAGRSAAAWNTPSRTIGPGGSSTITSGFPRRRSRFRAVPRPHPMSIRRAPRSA